MEVLVPSSDLFIPILTSSILFMMSSTQKVTLIKFLHDGLPRLIKVFSAQPKGFLGSVEMIEFKVFDFITFGTLSSS
jgi:hypothetical protein